MKRLCCIVLLSLAFGCDRSSSAIDGTAPPAASQDGISVYFSPGTDCGQLIIDKIRMAQKHVYVQAYSFTSDRIAKALNEVHKRGVEVKVILDDDKADKKSELDFLSRKGIDTYLDSKHEKAHSKVILIDGQTIITGRPRTARAFLQSNSRPSPSARSPGIPDRPPATAPVPAAA